mmetsp:Transcript_39775/g.84911  ORF Transcript_39775/g.84911 Transcript_39775/m.84911 type:complete len:90 (-) Transcript_39775:209-478(-)
MAAFDSAPGRPFIEPYQPPSARRGELPGDMEPNTPAERYMANMKRSPLPVTWGGVAGATAGALVGGFYGGAIGVGVGLYLERKWKKDAK